MQWEAKLTRGQIDAMQVRLRGIFTTPTNQLEIIDAVLKDLVKGKEIQAILSFVSRSDFGAYFGINDEDHAEMVGKLLQSFTRVNATEHSIAVPDLNGISMSILDQEYLRKITSILWTNTKKNSKPILVNAWDIIEYGRVGNKVSGGVIDGWKIQPAIGSIQRAISRSKRALMRAKNGASFAFSSISGAPKINAVRSSITFDRDKLVKTLSPVVKNIIKNGGF